jgi:ADP-heptose:LPS heptosyltransferase
VYFDPRIDYRTVWRDGYVPRAPAAARLSGWYRRWAGEVSGGGEILHREFRRIAVVKLGGIGDAVLSTTVIPHLRRRYPAAGLEMVCCRPAAPLLGAIPGVSSSFSSPLLDVSGIRALGAHASPKEKRRLADYFRTVDLLVFLNRIVSTGGFLKYLLCARLAGGAVKAGIDTSGRGGYLDVRVPDPGFLVMHEIDVIRDVLRALRMEIPRDEMRLTLPVPAAEEERIDRLLEQWGWRKFLVLHAGSSKTDWRGLKRIDPAVWGEVIRWAVDKAGIPVLLAGAGEDREVNEGLMEAVRGMGIPKDAVIDFTDRAGLPGLFHLIRHASLFVGTDSGVAHIASGTGTRSVVIFTFASPVDIAPWGRSARIVRRDLPCSPCIYWEGFRKCREMECRSVGAEDIIRAMEWNPGKGDAWNDPEQ